MTQSARGLCLAGLLVACGRDATTPTPLPTPTPLAPLSAIDGITGAVVPAAITPGGVTTASAPGYLLRETVQRGGVLTLWPTAPTAGYYMPEEYIHQMVYGWSPAPWTDRLLRWGEPLVLGLGPGLADVPGAAGQVDRVVMELAKMPWVSARRTDILAEAMVVYDISADAGTATTVAYAQIHSRGWTTIRAEAMFQDVITFFRFSTALHETGHVLGLMHSPRSTDLMQSARLPWAQRAQTFSGHETALLAMMYAHRRPGNAWPDRDLDLGAMAGIERMLTIRCE